MHAKTPLMLAAEKRLGGPLETTLASEFNRRGSKGLAAHLGVDGSLLCYWILRFQISTQRVAIPPGQSVVIRRGG